MKLCYFSLFIVSQFVPPCKTTKFIFSVTACMFMHAVVMTNFAVTQAMKTKDILIKQLEEKLRILSQQCKVECEQTRREHQQTKIELQSRLEGNLKPSEMNTPSAGQSG